MALSPGDQALELGRDGWGWVGCSSTGLLSLDSECAFYLLIMGIQLLLSQAEGEGAVILLTVTAGTSECH